MHVSKAVRLTMPLHRNNLGAKVRNNYEIMTNIPKILLFSSYIYTSMPLSMKMQHSRVMRIWFESSSLNFRVPL
jgi:hypothetical protein